VLVSLIVLICVLLTIVVLLQSGQGEGLSGGLAGGALGSQVMGARKTADLLSKSTTILATLFLVLCVLANFAIDRQGVTRSAVQQNAPAAAEFNFGDTPAPVEAPAPATSSETPQE
ncbi:preprotein translocase subunit SecG, partial [Arthrospira platensis SPKY1]|nr:preprotein translocase subunit SecG [Arthrospira platensis SPKY1]